MVPWEMHEAHAVLHAMICYDIGWYPLHIPNSSTYLLVRTTRFAQLLQRSMTSEDDANTQQNAKEEKPDVQTLQIKVRAQVRESFTLNVVGVSLPLREVPIFFEASRSVTMWLALQDGSELQFKIKKTTPLIKVTPSAQVLHCSFN